MKPLTLLLYLLLLGCEKRPADPNLENAREWLVSEVDLETLGLAPPQHWLGKRIPLSEDYPDFQRGYIFYAPLRGKNTGLMIVVMENVVSKSYHRIPEIETTEDNYSQMTDLRMAKSEESPSRDQELNSFLETLK
ncbi:MAG: hypothetical protein AAF514_05780 [Verrucomicrobiota bacterium]